MGGSSAVGRETRQSHRSDRPLLSSVSRETSVLAFPHSSQIPRSVADKVCGSGGCYPPTLTAIPQRAFHELRTITSNVPIARPRDRPKQLDTQRHCTSWGSSASAVTPAVVGCPLTSLFRNGGRSLCSILENLSSKRRLLTQG